MPIYATPGGAVECDVPLSDVPRVDAIEPCWRVRAGAAHTAPVETVYELRFADGRLWGVLAAGDAAYRLTFPDLVAFHIDARARIVDYVPAPDLAPSTLQHLIADQLLPHLLAIEGALVLHASCIGRGGGAVAFVGPSGRGKSSLAAAFVQDGASLLSDDYVLLSEHPGGYLAAPAYPSLRLWEDSAAELAATDDLPTVAAYTTKRRWAPPEEARAAQPLPLRALVAPGNEPQEGQPDVRVGRLRGADAFMVLYPNAFRMERAGRERQQAELDAFTELAARVPVLMVEYRRDYALLPKVVEAIGAAVDQVTRGT